MTISSYSCTSWQGLQINKGGLEDLGEVTNDTCGFVKEGKVNDDIVQEDGIPLKDMLCQPSV